ncbi:DUF6588 family protein [Sunxiuqinia sp. A32]|uniref:DUF6588 family protein n=1 Tax=Sunxiuqinia sp. A32 TaxID=3461496 RepID=UPI0040464465
MKKTSILILFVLVFKFAFTQGDVIDFIKAGSGDAEKLFEAYLNPYAMALGEGLNNGWFYSAETHHLLGFDVALSVSAISIPESDQYFDLNSLQFSSLEVINPSAGSLTPTIAGSMDNRPELQAFRQIDGQRQNLFSFHSPNGAGLDMVPVPMAQVSFGLLPHTDIVGRYVPELSLNADGDDVKVGLKGIGVKHNFKEWIPFLKHLPFDASLFMAYAKINAESELQYTSSDYDLGGIPYEDNYVHKDDQRLDFNTQSFKYGLILSKKVGIFTVFGSIGNTKLKSTIDLLGNYPILEDETDYVVIESYEDPLSLEIESKNVSMNAGFRLKLAFFKIFASVNKSHYTSYNAGIALGYR